MQVIQLILELTKCFLLIKSYISSNNTKDKNVQPWWNDKI
jgi:hypothetical protein